MNSFQYAMFGSAGLLGLYVAWDYIKSKLPTGAGIVPKPPLEVVRPGSEKPSSSDILTAAQKPILQAIDANQGNDDVLPHLYAALKATVDGFVKGGGVVQ